MWRPKVRESVDVYLSEDDELAIFHFLNTRREVRVRINDVAREMLALLDGTRTLQQLEAELQIRCGTAVLSSDIRRFLSFLQQKHLLTDQAYIPPESWFTPEELERYDRQISFWGDFCQTTEAKFAVQKRLKESSVAIIGCGAVGSWIAVELAMVGVGRLILVDHDRSEPSDVARHALATCQMTGLKVDELSQRLRKLNSHVQITPVALRLTPVTELDELCRGVDMVINCADEPYIGFTALKTSEYCVPVGKPHYVGGGFDAHLGSTGELILPGQTPCAFCYAEFFAEALKDWNPSEHPIAERQDGMGGLSCLSIFSASYAVLDILTVLTGLALNVTHAGRGEFMFERMDISFTEVNRNSSCRLCGDRSL